MAKANYLSNAILNLVFRAVAIANIADNAATSPLTTLWWALHTADPTASGAQNASEATYSPYARTTVARTTGGMTASVSQSTSPAAAITFPACTSGSSTVTHASVGIAVSGATSILYSGTVTPNINVTNGVTPQLTAASTITES